MRPSAVTWVLLIYTVASKPSRLRATIWRELKKVGAVYLRDGVAVLPDRDETRSALHAIADKIAEFDGQATLVEGAAIAAEREATIISQANGGRHDEYAELASEAEHFLGHVAHEQEHRELRFAELEELEADLGKLTRWLAQIRNRDHFGAAEADRAVALLAQCDAALETCLEESYTSTGDDGE